MMILLSDVSYASCHHCMAIEGAVCRASNFHHLGVAHALLNGLVQPFWDLVARDKKRILEVGEHLRVTKEQIAMIKTRCAQVNATSAYPGGLWSLLQCASQHFLCSQL